jgi:hypothetical protein
MWPGAEVPDAPHGSAPEPAQPQPPREPVFLLHIAGAVHVEVYRLPRRLVLWAIGLTASGVGAWGAFLLGR